MTTHTPDERSEGLTEIELRALREHVAEPYLSWNHVDALIARLDHAEDVCRAADKFDEKLYLADSAFDVPDELGGGMQLYTRAWEAGMVPLRQSLAAWRTASGGEG